MHIGRPEILRLARPVRLFGKRIAEMLPVNEVGRARDLDVDPFAVAQRLRRISVIIAVGRVDHRRDRGSPRRERGCVGAARTGARRRLARSECKLSARASLSRNGGRLPASFPSLLVDPPERRQRLTDDLVHIVIAVGGQPADERHALGRVRERLVALEQRLVLRPRDRIIRIALGRRIFVGDASSPVPAGRSGACTR